MPISRHRRRQGQALSRGARSAGSLTESRPRKKKTNKLYVIAALVIALLVIGSFGLTAIPFGDGRTSVDTGDFHQSVQGVGTQHPIMPDTYPNPHVFDSVTVDYSTSPPTSGKHWNRWAECDFHIEGLPDELITHNLEHGIIVVSYNLATDDEVDQLLAVVEGIELYEDWGLSRFYPDIDVGTVALAAWGVLDLVPGIDQDRMNRFFDAYAGNLGPEQIPCGFSHLGAR